MHVKTVFTCDVCTIDSACFGHIFSLIHCTLGLPSTMQRMQRLIYFSYIDHNMITIFEYFIIDCHQSLNIAAGRNYSCVHNVQFTFTETILMHLQVVNLLKWSFYMTINTTLPTLSLHLVLFLVPSRFHAASPPPKRLRKIQFEYRVFFNPSVEMNKLTL